MNKKLKIHFVCVGNTFRSRLAEAYLKSLKTKAIVSSSGINAKRNFNGPITIYSKEIANSEKIKEYLSPNWTQTTKSIIEKQDLVIFMKKKYYDFCINKLGCKVDNYQIWNIPDVFDYPNSNQKGYAEKVKVYTKNAYESYYKIKENIDALIIKEAL